MMKNLCIVIFVTSICLFGCEHNHPLSEHSHPHSHEDEHIIQVLNDIEQRYQLRKYCENIINAVRSEDDNNKIKSKFRNKVFTVKATIVDRSYSQQILAAKVKDVDTVLFIEYDEKVREVVESTFLLGEKYTVRIKVIDFEVGRHFSDGEYYTHLTCKLLY